MTDMNGEDAFNLALEHHEAGRLGEAEALYRQVLEKNPSDAEVGYLLGVVLGQQGHYEAAIGLILQVVNALPPDAELYNNLGEFYRRSGKPAEAAAAYRQAITIKPDFPEALSNLGIAQTDLGEFDEAIVTLQRAVAMNPGAAVMHNNLGNAFKGKNLFKEAIAEYRQAIELDPKGSDAYSNLGIALCSNGQLDEAIAATRQALAIKPDVETHIFLAVSLLRKGDFKQGWAEHECRWQRKDFAAFHTMFPQPQWDGSPLAGRTLLLHAEQGLGDTIQFARFAQHITKLAGGQGRVILACQKQLVSLLSTLNGPAQVIDYTGPSPEADVQCSLLSAPYRLGTTLETIPAMVPYVSANEQVVAHWRQELSSIRGLKVGIAWKGSSGNPADRLRSVPLAQFEVLSRVPGVTLISLQKGEGTTQITGTFPIVDFQEKLDEAGPFADTPAIMKNLDLVITVDTAICHLAGALGVPVWTVLSYMSDYRWMLDRDDSPWYPTMRLFRQPAMGDWESVMRRVAEELAKLAGGRGGA